MSELPRPIRLLVVEDSVVCRELLVTIFQKTPGLQVVGTARDGVEAVRLAKRLKPDVITMDVFMPEMNGYEATRRIMIEAPCPIVVVSGGIGNRENNLTFNALQAGALSIVPKPGLANNGRDIDVLITQVRLMAGVKVVRRKSPALAAMTVFPTLAQPAPASKIEVVVMAASTGGPGALAAILSELPADFPVPILIVQHVTKGFGEGLAKWLNQQTPLKVEVAREGMAINAGEIFISPDDCHLMVNLLGKISLKSPAEGDSYCPSADILFQSVAQFYGQTAVGIILTGMGSDGARGLRLLHQAGAHTIAQDEATSVIYGMPGMAVQMNAVEMIRPLSEISQTLIALL